MNRKIKSTPLAALIISVIAYLLSWVLGKILGNIQTALIGEMLFAYTLISIVFSLISLVLIAATFFIGQLIYFVAIEHINLKVGKAIGVSIVVAILRTIITGVFRTILTVILQTVGVNEMLVSIYNAIMLIVAVVVTFGGAMIALSSQKPSPLEIYLQQTTMQTKQEPTIQPSVQPVVQPEAKPAFCPNCGQKYIAGSQFCSSCGQKL